MVRSEVFDWLVCVCDVTRCLRLFDFHSQTAQMKSLCQWCRKEIVQNLTSSPWNSFWNWFRKNTRYFPVKYDNLQIFHIHRPWCKWKRSSQSVFSVILTCIRVNLQSILLMVSCRGVRKYRYTSIAIFCLAILYRFSKTEYRYKNKKIHTGFMAVSFWVYIPTAREQSSSLNLNSDRKY